MNDDYFRQLEVEFADITQKVRGNLKPGTLVTYTGSMLAAREHPWEIHTPVGDGRYMLAHPDNPWERFNVDSEDITIVPADEQPA